jgi:hypothetical protein
MAFAQLTWRESLRESLRDSERNGAQSIRA